MRRISLPSPSNSSLIYFAFSSTLIALEIVSGCTSNFSAKKLLRAQQNPSFDDKDTITPYSKRAIGGTVLSKHTCSGKMMNLSCKCAHLPYSRICPVISSSASCALSIERRVFFARLDSVRMNSLISLSLAGRK